MVVVIGCVRIVFCTKWGHFPFYGSVSNNHATKVVGFTLFFFFLSGVTLKSCFHLFVFFLTSFFTLELHIFFSFFFHHRFTHYKQNRVSGVLTSTLYTTLLFKVHIAGCETNGCPRSLPGIVKQDPVLPADKLLPPPAPRAPSVIFEDEEKSKVKDPLHGWPHLKPELLKYPGRSALSRSLSWHHVSSIKILHCCPLWKPLTVYKALFLPLPLPHLCPILFL